MVDALINKPLRKVFIVADYGDPGDMAFGEVSAMLDHFESFDGAAHESLGISSFATLANSTVLSQVLWNVLGRGKHAPTEGVLLFHNVAPRKDDLHVRKANRGESFYFAKVNGHDIFVAGPASGFSWSMLGNFDMTIYEVPIVQEGSQFRSRDYFPEMTHQVLSGKIALSSLGQVQREEIAPVPHAQVAYVDGFGNLKLSAGKLPLDPGTKIEVSLRVPRRQTNGMYTTELVNHSAIVAQDGFGVEEGQLAYSLGSSELNGRPMAELFLRGGRADTLFGINRKALTDNMTYKVYCNQQEVDPSHIGEMNLNSNSDEIAVGADSAR